MDDPFFLHFTLHLDKTVQVLLVLLYPFIPAECLADADHCTDLFYLRNVFVKVLRCRAEAWAFHALLCLAAAADF